MTKSFIAATAALITLVFFGQAAAQDLAAADVERFIAAMEALEAVGERYPQSELDDMMPTFTESEGLVALLDEEGRMVVFSKMADAMGGAEASPAIRDVTAAVKGAGFSSLDRFGEVGDMVVMALMALEIERDGGIDEAQLEQMRNMPPEMKAMMPPGVAEQMAAVALMAEAANAVPKSHVEAVKPYRNKLSGAFGE